MDPEIVILVPDPTSENFGTSSGSIPYLAQFLIKLYTKSFLLNFRSRTVAQKVSRIFLFYLKLYTVFVRTFAILVFYYGSETHSGSGSTTLLI